MMNKKLLLFGAGGHCRSIIDSIDRKQYSDVAIIDVPEMVGVSVFSIPIVGTDADAEKFFKKGYKQAVVTLGSVGNPERRVKLYDKLKKIGFQFPTIIDPTAIIASTTGVIENGVFIGKGAIVNTGVKIGVCAIINSGAVIDHDCEIGRFVHVGPGVSISGGVHVHDYSHVGVGSSIIQSVSIGKSTIIGAGSVVVSDIDEGVTAFGVPCKLQKKHCKVLLETKTMQKTFIIAEAGINHNGCVETAKKMIDAAVDFGADAIKFQTFCATDLVTSWAPKAEYQQKTTERSESQLDMIKKLELSLAQHDEIIAYCRVRNIQFLSTAFDIRSVNLLKSYDVPIYKIPSGEITNLPYLIAIAKIGKPIILSTGMSTLEEIKKAVEALKQNGADEITILHCNTEYPTPYEDVNLRAILTIQKELGVKVGYSDHTSGIEVSIAAVAMGAVIIEKHFTLDKNMEGPDHKASLEPSEFAAMVQAIRNIEKALGTGVKNPSPSEIKNMSVARKSVVAKIAIKKGEVFTEKNITVKRPGAGVSPMKWFEVLGIAATKNFAEDEMITL